MLSTLVEAWEAGHHPVDLPDPEEAIRYHMEARGLAPKAPGPYIGGRNRVYEVLNRKRPLTLRMVWRLHTGNQGRAARPAWGTCILARRPRGGA